jgi:hypothetical protein
MSDTVFPIYSLPGLTWSVFKTPTWSRRVQRSVSGREASLQDYAEPIWNFRLAFSYLRDRPVGDVASELDVLVSFYNEMLRSDDTFLFPDPSYADVDDAVIGTGDGATVTFALGRALTPAAVTPNALADVSLNGTLVRGYSVDVAGATITFVSPPPVGVVVVANFVFYYVCRFADDSLELEEFAKRYWRVKELRFRSVIA